MYTTRNFPIYIYVCRATHLPSGKTVTVCRPSKRAAERAACRALLVRLACSTTFTTLPTADSIRWTVDRVPTQS